ncbi:hypothetical protein ASG41_11560 [Modestobacter sp. Leaf380]|nr:hypothetical protein ASG41_11560 [Modestobacter sp. Leaf380]
MISGVDTTLVRWALAVALLGAGAVLLAVFLRVVRPAMKAGGPPDGRAALRRMALLPAGLACTAAGLAVAVSALLS